ncbi:DUF3467 domain-containing protein [Verrucomicrobiota bacterium sgz303538]
METQPSTPQSGPSPLPQVRWEDSGSQRTSRPNVCNVSSNRDEVTVLFGTAPSFLPGQEELTVRLDERVVLTPMAAKLLGQLINNVVRDYEAKFGPLGDGARPAPARPEPPTQQIPQVPVPAPELREKQAFLLALINALRVEYGYERSFKMLPGTLLANRSLLGINRALLTPELVERVVTISERLDMPKAFREQFRQGIDGASFVHFGYEENEQSETFKVYLESGEQLTESLEQEIVPPEGVPLHVGFKWDAADNSKAALARYVCFPGITAEAMTERMAAILPGPEHAATLEKASTVLRLVTNRVPHGKLLYLEVAEEGNPRLSFDVNLYAAQLRIADLEPLLVEICQGYGIPLEQFAPVFAEAKDKVFGHISGGIDRMGRDFLTFYFGVEGRGGK